MKRAVVLYLIAYKQGSVRAANHLALMFKKGLGVDQNNSLAFELYLESVNRADTPEIVGSPSYHGSAYYWLGYMAEHGEGTKRDLRAAKRWYALGATGQQSNCIDALADLVLEPHGIAAEAKPPTDGTSTDENSATIRFEGRLTRRLHP